MDKNYKEQLSCSKETKEMIMKDCVVELIRHHKELKGSKITQGQMLRQLAEFYLKE